MDVFIFKLVIIKFVIVFVISEDVPVSSLGNRTESLWSELNQFSSDERAARAISSFKSENVYTRECPGSVVSLSPGYATILKSHEGYGKVPYPSDYKVIKYKKLLHAGAPK